MFIRVFRPTEDKELLVNIASIWKIEVTYVVKGSDGNHFPVELASGRANPEAVRSYNVFFGDETILLVAGADDPAMRQIEQLYRDAVKG